MAGEPVLVVEDNQINLMLEKDLLSFVGYEVRTAANAKEAFEVLESFQPKLIIMDIQLPGMDGLELTRLIKANPNYQNIIVLAVTAYAMKGDKERILAAGCDGYLSKPIDTRALPKIVAEYISAKSY